MGTRYACEMHYEGRPEPTLARVVRVSASKALAPSEIDGTVLLCESDRVVVLDLPDQGDIEVRGFKVVNAGTGRVTVNAPSKGSVAGLGSFEVGPGAVLAGAAEYESDEKPAVKPLVIK